MLRTKKSLDRMAKASSMRWYGHVLRQVRSQKFAEVVGAILETISNNLDPNFDWSSLRFGRLFFPNLGDLQKKGLF